MTSTSTPSESISAAQRLVLVFFGLFFGGLLAGGVLWFKPDLIFQSKGSSFESLEEVRRAMLKPQAAEADAHGVSLGTIVTPHPDDSIIYELKPNLNERFQRAQVHTNSCGMRDKEYSISRPAGTYRIAFLGDSFTFGWGVEQEENFAARLEDNLNQVSQSLHDTTGPKFEVLNFGVPGYSTFQEVHQFLETGADFQPDHVVVYFIRNDFGYPFYVRDVLNPGGSLLSSNTFANQLKLSRDDALEQQRIQLLGLDANTSMEKLADYCRDHGIKLSVIINPKKGWELNKEQLWILKDRKKDIEFIKLRDDFMQTYEFRKIKEEELTLSFDPHPSALRHALLGDIMTPHFLDIIDGYKELP